MTALRKAGLVLVILIPGGFMLAALWAVYEAWQERKRRLRWERSEY